MEQESNTKNKLEHLVQMYDRGRLSSFFLAKDRAFLIRLSESLTQYPLPNPDIEEFQMKASEVLMLLKQTIETLPFDTTFILTSFNEWHQIIQQHFPELVGAAMACASVISQLKINDIKNPCALGLIDVPSSGKTITLQFFSSLQEIVYFSDNFTPASFVSHAANVGKEKLKDVDLLPRIKDKTIIIPELAPLFGARDDDLLKNFGVLTRVLDGEGLQTDSGLHGQRGYTGEYNFMLLAGSTPIQPRVWKVMGNLGARLFFYSIRSSEKDEDELINQLRSRSWKEKQKLCQETTANFIRTVWNLYPNGIDWNRENDPEEILQIIVKCAKLLSRLRAPINVWKERMGDGDGEYSHTLPSIEKPDRINQIFYNIARGHALISERTQLNYDDLGLVLDIAFDSCPLARSRLIRVLLEKNGELTTNTVSNALNCSDETARKEMEVFKILGIVDLTDEEPIRGRPQRKIVLKSDFHWFLSQQCNDLWQTSTASDSVGKVEQDPIPFPSKSDAVPVDICYACGSKKYYRTQFNTIVCVVCHPPSSDEEIVEWIEV